jgi:hypothetical protein
MLPAMKPRLLALLAFASALILNVRAADAAAPASLSLPPIFNGKDLAGWKADVSKEFWHAENGVLVGQNNEALKGNMLWTEKEYGDFVFECEVRWVGDIDSGIMMRKPELQLQFGTSGSLKKDMTGCFYVGGKDAYPEASRAHLTDYKSEQWNKWRIEARGTAITVWLNGRQVSQINDPKYSAPAPIGLQVHPGKKMTVEYRNIRAAAL